MKALDTRHVKDLLRNAQVLDHEVVDIMGLTVFGSTWCPWHSSAAPGDEADARLEYVRQAWISTEGHGEHRFNEIPEGFEDLRVHCPV